MNKKFALAIIKKTKDDYNKISDHFNVTRKYSWSEFKGLEEFILKDSKVLDIGCGNGRFFEFLTQKLTTSNKQLTDKGHSGHSTLRDKPSGSDSMSRVQNLNYTGIDISKNLVDHARKNHPEAEFLIGDFLDLSFEENSFDVVVSIAAFHHIPSEELRLQALAEIKRVLKIGGKFILTVWNLWEQEKYKPFIKSDNYSSTGAKRNGEAEESSPPSSAEAMKRAGKGRAIANDQRPMTNDQYDIGDSLIPWKFSDGKIGTLATERYYHAFTLEEAEKLFKKSGFKILKSEKTKFNLLFVLEK